MIVGSTNGLPASPACGPKSNVRSGLEMLAAS
jgi:hypothetical protein